LDEENDDKLLTQIDLSQNLKGTCILTPKNEDVNKLNQQILNRIYSEQEEIEFISVDT
jgi:hypothetical protein